MNQSEIIVKLIGKNNEGWALVECGNVYYLFTPPYRISGKSVKKVSEEDKDKWIKCGLFSPPEESEKKEFNSYSEIVKYISKDRFPLVDEDSQEDAKKTLAGVSPVWISHLVENLYYKWRKTIEAKSEEKETPQTQKMPLENIHSIRQTRVGLEFLLQLEQLTEESKEKIFALKESLTIYDEKTPSMFGT